MFGWQSSFIDHSVGPPPSQVGKSFVNIFSGYTNSKQQFGNRSTLMSPAREVLYALECDGSDTLPARLANMHPVARTLYEVCYRNKGAREALKVSTNCNRAQMRVRAPLPQRMWSAPAMSLGGVCQPGPVAKMKRDTLVVVGYKEGVTRHHQTAPPHGALMSVTTGPGQTPSYFANMVASFHKLVSAVPILHDLVQKTPEATLAAFEYEMIQLGHVRCPRAFKKSVQVCTEGSKNLYFAFEEAAGMERGLIQSLGLPIETPRTTVDKVVTMPRFLLHTGCLGMLAIAGCDKACKSMEMVRLAGCNGGLVCQLDRVGADDGVVGPRGDAGGQQDPLHGQVQGGVDRQLRGGGELHGVRAGPPHQVHGGADQGSRRGGQAAARHQGQPATLHGRARR